MRTLPVIVAGLCLTLAACSTSAAAARHPAHLTVAQDCRALRSAVLADGGTPDARTVEHVLQQAPGNAGAVHGRHGLTFDLDWLDNALASRTRGTMAGRLTIGTWQAALAGDCQRAAGVTVPSGG